MSRRLPMFGAALAIAVAGPSASGAPGEESCVKAGRIQDEPPYLKWPFENRCSRGVTVLICVELGEGKVVRLAKEIGSGSGADVYISQVPKPLKLTWRVGTGDACKDVLRKK